MFVNAAAPRCDVAWEAPTDPRVRRNCPRLGAARLCTGCHSVILAYNMTLLSLLSRRGRFVRPAELFTPLFVLIVLLCFMPTLHAQSDTLRESPRAALVIGNAAYAHFPELQNPERDARDVSQLLRTMGFQVTELLNADRESMHNAVRQFGERIGHSKAIGLFYYAGHGIEVGGSNYLIPVDAEIHSEDEIEFAAMSFDFVVAKARSAGNRANLFFLDACRDNPLPASTRSMSASRGLTVTAAPPQSLIVYATDPGQAALDGDGRNSPFAAALLDHLGAPGMDVELVLRNVRGDVIERTGGRQTPWTNSSLTEPVVLAADVAAAGSAELYVTSDPPGARVLLNGESAGETPLLLTDVPLARTVSLEAAHDGGLFTEREIRYDEQDLYEVHLELEQQYGNLVFVGEIPADMRLSVDGVDRGRLERNVVREVPAGPRTVVLHAPGARFETTVEIPPGRSARVAPEIEEWGSVAYDLPEEMVATLTHPDGSVITLSGHGTEERIPVGAYAVDLEHGSLPHWGRYAPDPLAVERGTEARLQMIASRPALIARDVIAASAGQSQSVYVTAAGEVFGAGRPWNGSRGGPYTPYTHDEVSVPISNAVAVAAGEAHTMILKRDGSLWGIGSNRTAIGVPGAGSYRVPVPVMEAVEHVIAGNSPHLMPGGQTLVVDQSGTLFGMGEDIKSLLDPDEEGSASEPVEIATEVQAVSVRNDHVLVAKRDGSLLEAGSDLFDQQTGQAGAKRLTRVAEVVAVTSVAAGGHHHLVLDEDGSAWSIGSNGRGQLGIGSTADTSDLRHVMNDVAEITAGWGFSMFLREDGTLWACGSNWLGQLGDGTLQDRLEPVRIMEGVASVSAGAHHALIIDRQGRLWIVGSRKHLGPGM